MANVKSEPAPRPSPSELLAILEDHGYRPTNQRRDVVSLLESKEVGFTVEELTEELMEVGRATVYRTVKLLLDAGVLCKVSLADGSPKYIVARREHHHHTVCVRCDKVEEFRSSTVERVLRTIGADIPGTIVGHRMEIFLVCASCADSVPYFR